MASALIAGSVLAGAALFWAIGAGNLHWALFMVPSVSGGIALSTMPFWKKFKKKMRKLNPSWQFHQANILNKYQFLENDIYIEDKDVLKATKLLKDILN